MSNTSENGLEAIVQVKTERFNVGCNTMMLEPFDRASSEFDYETSLTLTIAVIPTQHTLTKQCKGAVASCPVKYLTVKSSADFPAMLSN